MLKDKVLYYTDCQEVTGKKGYVMEDGSLLSEQEYDIARDAEKGATILNPLTEEISSIINKGITTIVDKELLELRSIPNIIDFVQNNAEFCGEYELMDDKYSYYKLYNSFEDRYIYIQITKSYFNGYRPIEKLKIS